VHYSSNFWRKIPVKAGRPGAPERRPRRHSRVDRAAAALGPHAEAGLGPSVPAPWTHPHLRCTAFLSHYPCATRRGPVAESADLAAAGHWGRCRTRRTRRRRTTPMLRPCHRGGLANRLSSSCPSIKGTSPFLSCAVQNHRVHHHCRRRARSSARFSCQPAIPGPPLGPPVAPQAACCPGRTAGSPEQPLPRRPPPDSAAHARRPSPRRV
jgi:hypothetical protein